MVTGYKRGGGGAIAPTAPPPKSSTGTGAHAQCRHSFLSKASGLAVFYNSVSGSIVKEMTTTSTESTLRGTTEEVVLATGPSIEEPTCSALVPTTPALGLSEKDLNTIVELMYRKLKEKGFPSSLSREEGI